MSMWQCWGAASAQESLIHRVSDKPTWNIDIKRTLKKTLNEWLHDDTSSAVSEFKTALSTAMEKSKLPVPVPAVMYQPSRFQITVLLVCLNDKHPPILKTIDGGVYGESDIDRFVGSVVHGAGIIERGSLVISDSDIGQSDAFGCFAVFEKKEQIKLSQNLTRRKLTLKETYMYTSEEDYLVKHYMCIITYNPALPIIKEPPSPWSFLFS